MTGSSPNESFSREHLADARLISQVVVLNHAFPRLLAEHLQLLEGQGVRVFGAVHNLLPVVLAHAHLANGAADAVAIDQRVLAVQIHDAGQITLGQLHSHHIHELAELISLHPGLWNDAATLVGLLYSLLHHLSTWTGAECCSEAVQLVFEMLELDQERRHNLFLSLLVCEEGQPVLEHLLRDVKRDPEGDKESSPHSPEEREGVGVGQGAVETHV
mmetsp:Transcript_2678/g.5432  ORF Transcript_2678/g.5432 Transcript_2678/m.5432 type:complete len:216 (-) Transcript_2678:586-1233(-)